MGFVESRGLLPNCRAQVSHCSGFSCGGAWGLGHIGSVVVMHGLSCSVACGMFLGQELKGSLQWQSDSQPLDHQEALNFHF